MNPSYTLDCLHGFPLQQCCSCMYDEVERLRARIHELQCQHDKQTATLKKELAMHKMFTKMNHDILSERYNMMTAPQRRLEIEKSEADHFRKQYLQTRIENGELRKQLAELKETT